jgi:hypothetical protein
VFRQTVRQDEQQSADQLGENASLPKLFHSSNPPILPLISWCRCVTANQFQFVIDHHKLTSALHDLIEYAASFVQIGTPHGLTLRVREH